MQEDPSFPEENPPLSPTDLALAIESRANEIAAITAIYPDVLHSITEFCLVLRLPPQSSPSSSRSLLEITVLTGKEYPFHAPALQVWSKRMPADRLEAVRRRMEEVVERRKGEVVVFELVEVGLEVCDEECGRGEEEVRGGDEEGTAEEWNKYEFMRDPCAFLGTNLANILKDFPPEISVLHAENILRPNLIQAFKRRHQELEAKYLTNPDGEKLNRRVLDMRRERYTTPIVAFHGSSLHNIASIVQSGLVIPGLRTAEGDVVQVASGSTWGRGIYVSPDARYSLYYSDILQDTPQTRRNRTGGRLLICAVLQGRAYQCKSDDMSILRGGGCKTHYDSHISPNKLEYILFDTAQVLPCYALHFTYTHP
ncbi:hypothetical protein HK104_002366, partial [Borealophlyctis nickersoniae]